MPSHIALLRGINVGGNKMIAMAELRAMVEKLGFTDVKTLLQSGNLVFSSARKSSPAALEKLLESETAKRFGMGVDFVIRSADELKAILANNPFPKEARGDPSHLLVMFFKSRLADTATRSIQAVVQGPELVRARGKELYLAYPTGVGTSKLTGALIERTLGVRGTARNWNTINKLLTAAAANLS
jgi:uncharacterized protein (DUF1697 family)